MNEAQEQVIAEFIENVADFLPPEEESQQSRPMEWNELMYYIGITSNIPMTSRKYENVIHERNTLWQTLYQGDLELSYSLFIKFAIAYNSCQP